MDPQFRDWTQALIDAQPKPPLRVVIDHGATQEAGRAGAAPPSPAPPPANHGAAQGNTEGPVSTLSGAQAETATGVPATPPAKRHNAGLPTAFDFDRAQRRAESWVAFWVMAACLAGLGLIVLGKAL